MLDMQARRALGDLIRPDRVHRDLYTDPKIFEWEMDGLFRRAWMLLGHDSQIPAEGDYFTARLGREPLLVVRGAEAKIHVLVNRCPHRGAAICTGSGGNAKVLQCPYHGWAFRHDGTLVGIPERQEFAPGFDFAAAGLARVPRMEVYRGFIFANGDADAVPLEQFLGPIRASIDNLVDRAPDGEIEVAGPPLAYAYRGNWKFPFENLNDAHHAAFAHSSAIAAARTLEARHGDGLTSMLRMGLTNGKPIRSWQQTKMYISRYGHSYFGIHFGIPYPPGIMAAYWPKLVARHGEEKARAVLQFDQHTLGLYPSSSWQTRYQVVRVFRPLAVDRTEVHAYLVRLKGAPDSVLEDSLAFASGNSGFNIITQDDLELFERCHDAMANGTAPWNLVARGVGVNAPVERDMAIHAATSEAYIRGQFAAWNHFMTGAPL